jgi:hypothetical protein
MRTFVQLIKKLRGIEDNKIVTLLRITSIGDKDLTRIKDWLENINKMNTHAICLTINHLSGGKLVQADLLGQMLQ